MTELKPSISCRLCNGTGSYMYDDNHSKPCEACCKHDKGWFALTEGFAGYIEGADNRCCAAGCGAMYRDTRQKEEGDG